MPQCRECHSRISKFDKDRCPVCGCVNPLQGVTSETVEITSQIQLGNQEFSDYKPKRRITAFFLSFFLGFFGIQFFYVGWKKCAIGALIFNLAFIGGVGTAFSMIPSLGWSLGYVVAVAIMLVINGLLGLYFLFKDSLKDGSGEFIK